MDLGVYVLTTASMYFGDHIVKTQSSCEKYPTGVDAADEIQLTYADGSAAQLRCSMVDKKRKGIFPGRAITIPETWNCMAREEC